MKELQLFLTEYFIAETKKSDWLLKASAEEFSLKECQTKFNEIGKPITQTQICVHSPKTFSDTCQGDFKVYCSIKRAEF